MHTCIHHALKADKTFSFAAWEDEYWVACKRLCDAAAGSGSQCLKTDNHLVLVDQAVRVRQHCEHSLLQCLLALHVLRRQWVQRVAKMCLLALHWRYVCWGGNERGWFQLRRNEVCSRMCKKARLPEAQIVLPLGLSQRSGATKHLTSLAFWTCNLSCSQQCTTYEQYHPTYYIAIVLYIVDNMQLFASFATCVGFARICLAHWGLDPNVESRCLTVRHANEQPEPKAAQTQATINYSAMFDIGAYIYIHILYIIPYLHDWACGSEECLST